MNASDNEGLGLSVVVYMAAIVAVLAVFAVPVYWANAPQVYENPKLAETDPLMNGPIVGKRISTRVPLAMLKHEALVDPAIVAALNAKAKKAEPARARQVAHQPAARTAGTPVAELRQEPARPSFFLFNLFGG